MDKAKILVIAKINLFLAISGLVGIYLISSPGIHWNIFSKMINAALFYCSLFLTPLTGLIALGLLFSVLKYGKQIFMYACVTLLVGALYGVVFLTLFVPLMGV